MEEQPHYIIVLYSKYSPQCQKFIEIFQKTPVPYIKPVCIDNKTIRQKIYSNTNLRVNTVPSVFLVYTNKKTEKFEGPQIYDWLISQITANLPPPVEEVSSIPSEPLSEPVIELTPIDVMVSTPPEPLVDNRKKSITELAAEMATGRSNIESGHKRHIPELVIKQNTPISSLPVVNQNRQQRTVTEIAADMMKDRV
jgi:hypothetical protein